MGYLPLQICFRFAFAAEIIQQHCSEFPDRAHGKWIFGDFSFPLSSSKVLDSILKPNMYHCNFGFINLLVFLAIVHLLLNQLNWRLLKFYN